MAITVKSLDDSVGMLARMVKGGYTKNFVTTDVSSRSSSTQVYTITENDDYAEIGIWVSMYSYTAYVQLRDSNDAVVLTLYDSDWLPMSVNKGKDNIIRVDLRGLAGYSLYFYAERGDSCHANAYIYTKGGTS